MNISSRPLFSCVVPVKGKRPWLAETLESIGDGVEVIVQDGDVEEDNGLADALNRGFAKARGEWLFWLNADDVLLPGAIAAVQKEIRPERSWLSGGLAYLDANGRVLRCIRERAWRWSYNGFPVRVCGPSSFFRRELWQQCGPFDETLCFSMDTDLWCRFRTAGFWHNKTSRLLFGFRIHEASRTAGDICGKTPPAMIAERKRLLSRYNLSLSFWRVTLLRMVRMIDGSTFSSILATLRWRGKSWREVVQ